MAPRPGKRPRSRSFRLRVGGLATAVAVAVATACTSDSAPETAPSSEFPVPAPNATATATPNPTSPADLAGQQAVTAYVNLWQAMAEASHTADWQDPELPRYASGSALQVLTGSLYADHVNGLVSRGEPVLSPEVTSTDPPDVPTTVMLFDCADSTNWLQYRADGSPVDDEPGGRRAVTSEVRLHADGAWKVTRFAVEEIGSC